MENSKLEYTVIGLSCHGFDTNIKALSYLIEHSGESKLVIDIFKQLKKMNEDYKKDILEADINIARKNLTHISILQTN